MRRTQKEARRIVDVWQRRMALHDWTITVEFEGADEDANASVWFANDYKRAVIHFGRCWQTHGVEEFNQTVVHELMHVLTRGTRLAQKAIMFKGLLTRSVEDLFEDRYTHEWEAEVDHMADLLLAGFGPA